MRIRNLCVQMMGRGILAASLICGVMLLGTTPASAKAADGRAPQKIQIADGVYLFISPDWPPIEVNGNSIAVVNARDVLVFDSNVLPADASAVLAEIRKITDKPVRYVVNSHWHPDHWDGNELYAKEFPNVEIIASEETRRLMENTQNVYVKTLQFFVDQIEKQVNDGLSSGKGPDGAALTDKDKSDLQEQLSTEREFMKQYKAMHPVLPTLAYDDHLTLYDGGQEIRLMRFVGNTPADTALYLPKEKVLLTGDLLTSPTPYGAGAHPRQWIKSLKTLEQLDVNVIVPGHGQPQHDKVYLRQVIDALQYVEDQVHEAVRRGMTLEETKKFVNLDAVRTKFTHNDPELNADFDGNFGGPIVRQAYDDDADELELFQ